jgi:hypothetical protein
MKKYQLEGVHQVVKNLRQIPKEQLFLIPAT